MDFGELNAFLLTPAAQVALIIGLAELIKRTWGESRFIPLVDLALGLISGIFVHGIALGYGIPSGIMIGIALGLSACGLFSGIKNLTEMEDYDG